MGEKRHADAGVGLHSIVLEQDRLHETVDDALTNKIDAIPALAPHQQDRELVPTLAGHEIRCSDGGLETGRRLDQQRIAGIMLQCVIDLLEPVQVEQQ